jgi:hypothetical protein
VTYAAGEAIALLRAGGIASGLATATNDAPAGALEGDATVDRHAIRAFLSRVRLMRPEVYVGDLTTPLAELVDSVEVTETLDELVVAASFTVAKAEASPFHSDSILVGNRPCRIELWIGPPGGVGAVNFTSVGSIGMAGPAATAFDDGVAHDAVIGPGGLAKYALFEGFTDPMQDSAAYRTRAQVQAISTSSLWADIVGCVRLNAFSGLTRAQVVQAMATSAGITVGGLDSLGSAKVYKPVDEMGGSTLDLIRRYGEIEGWRARLSRDGAGIEVLSEDQLLSGSPVYEFDESNTFNVGVSTPSRPVTDWIVSGARISMPTAGTKPEDEGPVTKTTVTEGLDSSGLPTRMVETVESWGGAERIRTSETWRTAVVDGSGAGFPGPAGFFMTDRLTIVTEWADFYWYDDPVAQRGLHTRPAAQMNKRTTTTETMTGIPASSDFSTTYVWGGGRWLADHAALTLIERVTETFNWLIDECRLVSSLSVAERLFSQRVDPLDVTSYSYDDGSERATDFYLMMEVERTGVIWTELSEAGSAPKTTMQEYISSWIEADSPTHPGTPIDVFRETGIKTITWQGNLADTNHTKTTTVIQLGMMNSTEIIFVNDATPGAPRGSTADPVLQQEVMMKIFRASAAAGYIAREGSPSAIDFAESIEELETWARRRLRRDHARTVTISHRMVPYLRVGDFVRVTCRPKQIVAVDGYVSEIRRTLDVLNGGARQTTTMKVPPSWV